jgi:hypothetical protein
VLRRASRLRHLSVLFATLVATPAQAATTGALRGTGSGRCLDVSGAGRTDGTNVQIRDCRSGTDQQRQR